MSECSERAVVSYRATTPEMLLYAVQAEIMLAGMLKGRVTPKNCPVDVIVDDVRVGVEVKTVQISDRIAGIQIHMNKRAKDRKRLYAQERHLTLVTVVIDLRDVQNPRYYMRDGIGSFRLNSMLRVTSPRAIRLQLLQASKSLVQ